MKTSGDQNLSHNREEFLSPDKNVRKVLCFEEDDGRVRCFGAEWINRQPSPFFFIKDTA